MKTLLFISLFTSFSFIAAAQQNSKNEFSIGLGSLEINHLDAGAKNPAILNKKLSCSGSSFRIFDPMFITNGMNMLHSLVTKSKSLPALYYTRNLNRHLALRISYQYASYSGIVYLLGEEEPQHSHKTFATKNHEVQAGLAYKFRPQKKLVPHVGIGLHTDTYLSTYTMHTQTGDPVHSESRQRTDGVRGCALFTGISVKLCCNMSATWETSMITDFERTYYRPVNRLSLNFAF